jgi:CheY-like chemotaxis protein
MTAAGSSLAGLRILIVEDETLIAMMLETLLGTLGCRIAGSAATVTQALDRIVALGCDLDAAVLDVNLGGEKVYPVADALAARGVPFMFATGYGPRGVSERYPDHMVIAKPYQLPTLSRALQSLF